MKQLKYSVSYVFLCAIVLLFFSAIAAQAQVVHAGFSREAAVDFLIHNHGIGMDALTRFVR